MDSSPRFIVQHGLLGKVEVIDKLDTRGRFFYRSDESHELVGYESAVYVTRRREEFNQQHVPPFGEFATKTTKKRRSK